VSEPRHFLSTESWSHAEVLGLLDRAAELKRVRVDDQLRGQRLGLVFFNPSLRTRTSFELAVQMHGGMSVTLEPGNGVWGFETEVGTPMLGEAAEHVTEAAGVLGRYVDAIGIRAFPQATSWAEARRDTLLHAFAELAGVPIINMEGARRHPCQELADALTLRERFGGDAASTGGTGRRRVVVQWCWHPKALPTAVPASAVLAGLRVGCDVTLCAPEGFELDGEDVAAAQALATTTGAALDFAHSRHDAADGADVIYAKAWGGLDRFEDPSGEEQRRGLHRDWCVDADLMRRTRDGAFMHCLPVRRNVVVRDEVLDGSGSIVLDQAENRLHVQRALLTTLLGGHSNGTSDHA